MTPSIAIVVLNWNGRDDTLRCLDSLRRSTYQPKRIVVVDNGSTDDSVAAIARIHPDIEVLCTGSNLGYAGGNNVGLRHCRATGSADFYLLLNNDTTVDVDLFEQLVETAARHPTAGVFSPKIYFFSKPLTLWFAGARWSRSRSDFFHIGEGEKDTGQFGETDEVDYLSGCALFVRAEVIDKIGMLDERYFLLFEDVDFCYRAKEHGYRCVVAANATMQHAVSSSIGAEDSPLAIYFHSRNRLLFSERLAMRARSRLLTRVVWESLFPQIQLFPGTEASLTKRLYWLIKKRRLIVWSDYAEPRYRAHLLGVFDYARRRFGDCPKSIHKLTQDARPVRLVHQADVT